MEYRIIRSDELYHYGVRGMKWGVRRTQPVAAAGSHYAREATADNMANRKAKVKKAAKIGAAVAITALAAYGAYKYGPEIIDKISKGRSVSSKQQSSQGPGFDEIMNLMERTRNAGTSPVSQSKRDVALTVSNTAKRVSESQREKTFDPSKFTFKRNAMLRPDGGLDYVDIPVDKKGYTHEFAKSMAKNKKDYDYWYSYMERRLRQLDG